jgi:hypothetical protein
VNTVVTDLIFDISSIKLAIRAFSFVEADTYPLCIKSQATQNVRCDLVLIFCQLALYLLTQFKEPNEVKQLSRN